MGRSERREGAGMTTFNQTYTRRWVSSPGPDGAKQYAWEDFLVWREFEGQWWLTGANTGDDLGPFGSSIRAKDWAVHLREAHLA